jgi:hypothetical protein
LGLLKDRDVGGARAKGNIARRRREEYVLHVHREASTEVNERERWLRRAKEARSYVARVAPELLDTTAVDTTLHDLTLARSVLERLDDAYRHELGNGWLRGLGRARSSRDR